MLIRLTAPYIVVRRLKLGPVGRPGRGKREDENLWHETVRFAVDTGAMFRPSEEFEFVMDDFCVHYKAIHGATTAAAAVRSAVSTLRMALYCGISPVNPDGSVRPKGKVRQAIDAHLALTGRQIPRKRRRPKNGR